MAEKPILFTGEMVKAILDGRKTQTRRIIKPQPKDTANEALMSRDKGEVKFFSNPAARIGFAISGWIKCPYGRPGDLLWGRETWATLPQWNNVKPSALPANGVPIYYTDDDFGEYKKRPSIFMPRWASRITLRVTAVRVERVQDITIADLIAEGAWDLPEEWGGGLQGLAVDHEITFKTWQTLWDSINEARGYGLKQNPWVWVVTFEKLS